MNDDDERDGDRRCWWTNAKCNSLGSHLYIASRPSTPVIIITLLYIIYTRIWSIHISDRCKKLGHRLHVCTQKMMRIVLSFMAWSLLLLIGQQKCDVCGWCHFYGIWLTIHWFHCCINCNIIWSSILSMRDRMPASNHKNSRYHQQQPRNCEIRSKSSEN